MGIEKNIVVFKEIRELESDVKHYEAINKVEFKNLTKKVKAIEKKAYITDDVLSAFNMIALILSFFLIAIMASGRFLGEPINRIEAFIYCAIIILGLVGASFLLKKLLKKYIVNIDNIFRGHGLRYIKNNEIKKLKIDDFFEKLNYEHYAKIEQVVELNDVLKGKIKEILNSGKREELFLIDFIQLRISEFNELYKNEENINGGIDVACFIERLKNKE